MGLYDLDRDGLTNALSDYPKYRVNQLIHGIYANFLSPQEISELPSALRQELASREDFQPSLREDTRRVSDRGLTTKYLFSLSDGRQIESVLMYGPKSTTVCISSQAGCAMACKFCATGDLGFSRHLGVGEIVEQVITAAREAKSNGSRLDHVVYMGMGEPLANCGPVIESLHRIIEVMGLSARKVTLSTVGIVPGIKRLAKEELAINLAVSLHAANDDLRSALVPINKTYPIAILMEACAHYLSVKNRRISFEWALMSGVNDSEQDAKELAKLAKTLYPAAHVNLIPLNPTTGAMGKGLLAPSKEKINLFSSMLSELGVNATVRRTRGQEIAAACGQLAGSTPEDSLHSKNL
jgi:23S rRNA (adenine2503-C2)-methyltransferase